MNEETLIAPRAVERLRAAVDDLDQALQIAEPPALPAESRRAAPPMWFLASAAAVALVVAAFGVVRIARDNQTTEVNTAPAAEINATVVEAEPVPTSETRSTESAESVPAQDASRDETPWPSLPTLNSMSSDLEVRQAALVDRPGTTEATIDPAFGAPIVRITDADLDQAMLPVYSTVQAWNADSSRILLYRAGGRHVVFEVGNTEPVAELALALPDIEQVFWDAQDPSLIWYAEQEVAGEGGARVVAFNIETEAVERSVAFDGCLSLGGGESTGGFLSHDGSVMGMWCDEGDGESSWITFNPMTGDTIGRRPAEAAAAPIPSASGELVVIDVDGDIVVFDAELTEEVRRFSWPESFVLAAGRDGRDVLAGVRFSEPAASVITVDLLTGDESIIIGPEDGYPYPPGGVDFSAAAPGRPSLLAVATRSDSPDDPALLVGEIFLVDLALDDPVATRLAHHRATAGNESAIGAWARAAPTLNRDGTGLLFSSDWFLGDRVDTYEIRWAN